jgi:hypothetical protein
MTVGPLPAPPSDTAPAASDTPRVSILTATYNRSNVRRLVIETVRRQTVTDWEWIIVGDRGPPPIDWKATRP